MDPINSASSGIYNLINNNNIAIAALSVMAFFEAALIWYLLKGIFNFQEVLKDLEVTVRLLNERINHRGE